MKRVVIRELLIEKWTKPDFIYPNDSYICWLNKYGEVHRDNDLPAVIYKNGDKVWYKNDLIHRDGNKPAVILKNVMRWYKNGLVQKQVQIETSAHNFNNSIQYIQCATCTWA